MVRLLNDDLEMVTQNLVPPESGAEVRPMLQSAGSRHAL